jgi:hypothetical protein
MASKQRDWEATEILQLEIIHEEINKIKKKINGIENW